MGVVDYAALAFLAMKLTSFLKFLTSGSYRDAVTQGVAWVAGAAVVLLVAASDFADGLALYGKNLGDLNFASCVVLGLLIGSGGSVIYDYKAARDNKDTAEEPALFGKAAPAPPLQT